MKDDPADGVHNEITGDAHSVVQARDIHGDVVFHAAAPREGADPRPLVLAGAVHTNPVELAATVRANWSTARRRFVANMGTSGAPSEGWRDLATWLRSFDDPEADDIEGRIELIDRRLTGGTLPPDVKLLYLLRWLDPNGEAVYRGHSVTVERLAEVALRRRLAPDGADARLYEDLHKHRLLDVFAGFARLRGLKGKQRDWDDARKRWHIILEQCSHMPRDVRRTADRDARRPLLATVLPPPAKSLRPADVLAQPSAGSVAWFDELISKAGGARSPFGMVAQFVTGELASAYASRQRADGERARQDREADRQRREAGEERARLQREWADYESGLHTPAARLLSIGRAAVWVSLWSCLAFAAVSLLWVAMWDWTWQWGSGTASALWLAGTHIALAAVPAVCFRAIAASALGGTYRPPILRPAQWLPTRRPDAVRLVVRLALFLGMAYLAGALTHDFLAAIEKSGLPRGQMGAVAFTDISPFGNVISLRDVGSQMALGEGLSALCFVLVSVAVFVLAPLWAGRARRWDEAHQQRVREYQAGR
ncbi:hypothetical protein CLV63_115120 [Murinocardiopsis flavida]|uniref:Uncharacterized protein n=1 Tax=Murinocardiopsis flavida TaxID=645275 RepID=A0A2P8DE02_9ACTN|nr:hypothetical protein [Murinocardiopsis flavida]PSK95458.1 hypothetical protein CLV63_115120 [Murinocardiopsis flavida]